MKKILALLFLILMLCNTGFAESYYFKECKLADTYSGNYLIDFDKNVVNVSLVGTDGSVQKKTYIIKFTTKDKIITEKKRHATRKEFYFQYHLDAKSKLVSMQKFRKKHEGGLYSLEGPKAKYLCENVKANWDKGKKEGVASNKAKEKSLQVDSSLPKCQGSDLKQWKNCQGFYTTENGYKYNGQFKEGKILKGSAIYPGGAKYVGKFKDDKPHGQGTFAYPDGSKHFGEWKAGVGHGHGIKTWKDGRKYVGKFKDDKPHGQGTFTYPDGSKYIGQYKGGKRHGEGTLTYNDGKTYVGQFVAGYEYGDGICINQDGSSVNCKMDSISKEKNMHNISIVGKKWIKISKYKTTSGEQLKNDFDKKAYEICSSTENFNILEKKIEVFEMDETPAFGLETVVKLGISGVIECI